ncbi:myb/SANT-like DNA-binding domain-containing protein 1 [Bactrocera neohumeralis]|uniref:myb/SANT-like DNA-binding domain-containing protein 1 n=1 Tax=Bactrocera neohumeralis TaxID=98809 RepID=UPI0021655E4D|nr:myb/SANT-like DNA-binding domain-containing protein 1 [Bactrocera neohumeralis]
MEKTQKKKRVMWSEAAEADLIEVWQQKMPELRSTRKNNHIYEEMSCTMLLAGHEYTSIEIKIKLHNFTNKYRQEKQKIGPSGGSPSRWKYYEAVHQAVGGFKSFCSDELVEDSIVVDMEPIYIEDDTEGEPPLPSPSDGPSTSRGCARPSSSDAARKKKSTITIMEEMKDDLIKATEAMKESDEKEAMKSRRLLATAEIRFRFVVLQSTFR